MATEVVKGSCFFGMAATGVSATSGVSSQSLELGEEDVRSKHTYELQVIFSYIYLYMHVCMCNFICIY